MAGRGLLESLLLAAFRLRTRGFLAMEECPGEIPPPPREGKVTLYLHIPFCQALCPFCSFHRVVHEPAMARRYFQSLRAEVVRYHEAGYRFSGAYFGGGTPTSEPAELLETIRLVRRLFGVAEVSVETNPRDLRPALLGEMRGAGVTRLSVGVQSFDDRLLREMGRLEQYGGGAEIRECVSRAAGIFPTLNLDLIYNLPDQDLASLERDLEIVRGLGANQVSFYPLMAAPSTRRRMIGSMGLPEGSRLRLFHRTILSRLRPDFTPTSCWCFSRGGKGTDEYVVDADHYVGVGSGAFSYLDGTLYATSFSLQAYEARIARGLCGIVSRHRLGAGDRCRLALLTRLFGLRLDREDALRRHGPRFFRRTWAELLTLECLGAARRDAGGWSPTDRGMYWLVLMMSAFYESVNGYREAMRAHVAAELRAMEAAPPAPAPIVP